MLIINTSASTSLPNYWAYVQRAAAAVVLLQRKLREKRQAEIANSVFGTLHDSLDIMMMIGVTAELLAGDAVIGGDSRPGRSGCCGERVQFF